MQIETKFNIGDRVWVVYEPTINNEYHHNELTGEVSVYDTTIDSISYEKEGLCYYTKECNDYMLYIGYERKGGVTMENEAKEEVRRYEVDLPEFPMEALPPNLRQFVEAVSANVQVSPDMVAVPLLATLCVPLQSRFVVRVDSTYAEPLCLYTLTVARPSERKSAIIRILESPLWEYQRIMNEDLPQGQKPTTLYVTDATPEKLARLMEENKGAIALLSDEPDALAVAAGLRYGKSKNLGLMLQAWSAGRVMIQRATEDKRIVIDRAVMSVAVMSQPSFVENLM